MREIFQRYLNLDQKRVRAKYARFWSERNRETEFYMNISNLFAAAVAFDATCLMLYYKAEARSKDTTRIFQTIAREVIEHHGYGPDQSRYLAVWYFLVVSCTEYDCRIGLTERTDIEGMFDCFVNTGEIDYEHDWTA